MRYYQIVKLTERVSAKFKSDLERWADENDVDQKQSEKEYDMLLRKIRNAKPTDDSPAVEHDSQEEHEMVMARMGEWSLRGGGFDPSATRKPFKREVHPEIKKLADTLRQNAPSAVSYFIANGSPMFWRGDILKQFDHARTYDTNTGYRTSAHAKSNLYSLFLSADAERNGFADRQRSLIGIQNGKVAKDYAKGIANEGGGTLLAVFPWEDALMSHIKTKDIWGTKFKGYGATQILLNFIDGGDGSFSRLNHLLTNAHAKFDNLADMKEHLFTNSSTIIFNAAVGIGHSVYLSKFLSRFKADMLKNPKSMVAMVQKLMISTKTVERLPQPTPHAINVAIIKQIMANWMNGLPTGLTGDPTRQNDDTFTYEGVKYLVGPIPSKDARSVTTTDALSPTGVDAIQKQAEMLWSSLTHSITNQALGVTACTPATFSGAKGEVWAQGKQTVVPAALLADLLAELKGDNKE
jgi:hypothetical protein